MTQAITPRFKHDCTNCKFVGRLDGQDAYICTSSVVLRKSSDGSDYDSVPIEMAQLPNDHSHISLERFRVVLRMEKF